MTKIKVIYILSLSHSGSTVLDLLLSHHPAITGLGEVYSVFTGKKANYEGTQSVCSCGNDLRQCYFWGSYFAEESKVASYKQKYTTLLELAAKKGLPVLVDSSKTTAHLEPLLELEKEGVIDLRVVYLVRDARGWVTSDIELGPKMNKRRFALLSFIRWYKHNKARKAFLERAQRKALQISYAHVMFDTEGALKKIVEYAELEPAHIDLTATPRTHIAYGNRTKISSELKLVYDTRWMHRYWVNFWYVVLVPIFLWNKRNVPMPEYKR